MTRRIFSIIIAKTFALLLVAGVIALSAPLAGLELDPQAPAPLADAATLDASDEAMASATCPRPDTSA